LEIKLPFVNPRSTARELDHLQREAIHALEVYRTAVRATYHSKEFRIKSTAEIKKKYNDRIKVGDVDLVDMLKYFQILNELFEEWCPIGRTPKELEEVTGVKLKEERNGLNYLFRFGRVVDTDTLYTFHLDSNGRIRAVEIRH